MLELTTFQIFFMVLHGALLVFLVAFLTRGASDKKDNVVNLQKAKRRRKKKKKSAKQKPSFSFTPSPQPAAASREVREVREVRDVTNLLEARSAQPAPEMVRYSLSTGQRRSSW